MKKLPDFTPRAIAPSERTSHDQPMAFRVWCNDPPYAEDPLPWKVSAAFRFLTEALDYIAYCQDRGATVVFQSPADVVTYRPDDRRAVYKPESPVVTAPEGSFRMMA